MASALEELRKFNREHFHWIWKVSQAGDLETLSDEDMRLGEIMLEHEEYHNQFEIADHLSDHEFDVETETNPFLHIVIHQVVENQLEARDPIEAYQFFNAMRRKKISRHDVIHLIGSILSFFMYDCLKESKEFDLQRYKSLLKKYKNRSSDKIASLLENDFD